MNQNSTRLASLLSAVTLLAATVLADDDGFSPLFSGKDLSGWVQVNCADETFAFGIESFLINDVAYGSRKVSGCDAIECDLSDRVLTGSWLPSRFVINIAGEACEIGVSLLLPSAAEVVNVDEVDQATNQDSRSSEHCDEGKVSLVPHEPVIEQIPAPSGHRPDGRPHSNSVKQRAQHH